MGRVRTKDIKTAAFNLIQQHKFTTDFEENKKILSEMNLGLSKRIRNKIAGYITRVMKRNTKIAKT